nr:unnamed protein product [Digitaria exilis]
MATTAAAYGCSTAASLLPFAAFPGRLPYRRSSPPPRVCLFSTSKPRATGCQVYHKFVDNLGLVVEYDLREENALQEENVVSTNSED